MALKGRVDRCGVYRRGFLRATSARLADPPGLGEQGIKAAFWLAAMILSLPCHRHVPKTSSPVCWSRRRK